MAFCMKGYNFIVREKQEVLYGVTPYPQEEMNRTLDESMPVTTAYLTLSQSPGMISGA